jgi:hypothetical protein
VEVSGQLHAPAALLPGKEPLLPTYRDSNPPIIQPVAQRYTAEISRVTILQVATWIFIAVETWSLESNTFKDTKCEFTGE